MQTEQLSVRGTKAEYGRELVDRKLIEAPSNFIAGRPKAVPLFWFFKVALLSICLWSASIVATCISCPLCSLSCFIITN